MQGEGKINGTPFYFRSRWDSWEFCVGRDPLSKEAWVYKATYPGGAYNAGYISKEEAQSFIQIGADAWFKENLGK